MLEAFLEYPREINLTYKEHFIRTFSFSVKLYLTSIKVLIHSVFPFLFKDSTSSIIDDVENQIIKID